MTSSGVRIRREEPHDEPEYVFLFLLAKGQDIVSTPVINFAFDLYSSFYF